MLEDKLNEMGTYDTLVNNYGGTTATNVTVTDINNYRYLIIVEEGNTATNPTLVPVTKFKDGKKYMTKWNGNGQSSVNSYAGSAVYINDTTIQLTALTYNSTLFVYGIK